MIDVTKFEGHTKVEFSVHGNIIRAQVGPMNSVIAVCYCDEPTKHLFASAPELLAEVMRLREEVGKLRALLLGVLENDEAAGGFNNANLGELRDEIRNAVAWKVL